MAFPKMRGSHKPTSFSRPAVDLDRAERKWQQVPAGDLQLEDIVPDLGMIIDINHLGGVDYVRLTGAGGKMRAFMPGELVFAFTNAK